MTRPENPGATGERYPGFWTWCSCCGEGQQEAARERVENGEAIYVSLCPDCMVGFDVKVPAGSPNDEARAFIEQMSDRWRRFDA